MSEKPVVNAQECDPSTLGLARKPRPAMKRKPQTEVVVQLGPFTEGQITAPEMVRPLEGPTEWLINPKNGEIVPFDAGTPPEKDVIRKYITVSAQDNASRNAAIKRRMRSLDDKLVVCRAIRQSTQTALFDVVSSQKKLNYFREQAAAITKARAAYEQQFAVGRRSLLDLLSAENEYYQAQRALINIEADLSISKLKLLAATGQLITLFSVDSLVNADEPTKRNVVLYQQQADTGAEAEGCPASLINLEDFDLPNIGFDEALKSVDASQSIAPIELAQLDAAVTGQNVASFGDPAEVSKSLIDKTNSWAKAWENKDVNSYIAFYAPNFKPEEGSYEAWVSNRRERIAKAQEINIEIADLQVVPSFDKPDEYEISFIQDYRAKYYQERSKKVLTWKESKGIWQIIREQNMPMSAMTGPNKKNMNLAEAPTE